MEYLMTGLNDSFKLISTFVDAVALIMALVLMVSIMQRVDRHKIGHALLMGTLFSLALAFSMSDPIDLGSAGIFDMRGLLIGAGVALFGPVVGLMTLITGLIMRWEIGGNGMIPGFVGMLCAYGGGLVWLLVFKKRHFATWKKSVLLGLLITSQMLAIFFAPQEIWASLFVKLVPYTLATNVLGALLINHLISGELSFLSEAETSKLEANTDHLTGLLNRRGLDLIFPNLKHNLAPPKGRALLCFDIDKFKDANDTFGHAIGDEVLKRVVDRVSANLRQNDIFARLGGDEFAVILPEVDVKIAEQIADRCRTIVAEEAFTFGEKTLPPTTISVGAIWLRHPTELEVMLQAADDALYQAKSKGRNAVVFLSVLNQRSRPSDDILTGALA